MQYETKKRSILKAISWRTWATITTTVLVLIFTGEVGIAITVGLLEVFAKMGLYFLHERFWQKVHYGKREVPACVVWFTGLPASGKKRLANAVYEQLKHDRLKVERLDSQDIRPLFPNTGFAPDDVDRHIRRAGHLASVLEKNGIIVITSFVSPFAESRDFARNLSKNFVEVHMKTSAEACEQRDEHGHYKQAREGKLDYFPGVTGPYEEPENAEVVIDVDTMTDEESTAAVIKYIKSKVLIQ